MSMRKTIKRMFQSALICLVCISFLTGSTYAWVTELQETISEERNGITKTAVKPQLSWTDDLDTGEWHVTTGDNAKALFHYTKWEPGYMQVRYIRLENGNTFPLKYVLNIETQTRVPQADLARVIDVYFIPVKTGESLTEVTSRQQIEMLEPVGTLAELMVDNDGAAYGVLGPKSGDKYGKVEAVLILHMREDAGNEYQGSYVGNDKDNGFNLYIRFDEYNAIGETY